MDFGALDETENSSWRRFLEPISVYALSIPSRKEHITGLLERWGFHNAVVVDGIKKDSIDLDDWVNMGRVRRWPNLNQGRVACHFGHRMIMRRFLEDAPQSKRLCLIFEDDLLEHPTAQIRDQMLSFFQQVPPDFDILHLGFLWEDEQMRKRVGETSVYKTYKGVGRHAYVVTRQSASTLLCDTYPQSDAGDQMYVKCIRNFSLKAYQPVRPIFTQDREVFPISELTGFYRPARDFQPPRDEMRRWNKEVKDARSQAEERRVAAMTRPTAESGEQLLKTLQQLGISTEGLTQGGKDGRPEEAGAAMLRALQHLGITNEALLSAKDGEAAPGGPSGPHFTVEQARQLLQPSIAGKTSEPEQMALSRTYQVVGSWDSWGGFAELERRSQFEYAVEIPVAAGLEIEFQLVCDFNFDQRFFPAPNGSPAIVGPFNGGHGQNWRAPTPQRHGAVLIVQWNPTGQRSLRCSVRGG